MKKNNLYRILFALALPLLIIGCDDDEASTPTDFAGIASTYYEENGTTTVTIPLRNASGVSDNNLDIEFGGTAVEGEDFELVGITEEGVQISIIDDDDLEDKEEIRVKLSSPSVNVSGNSIHTITIVSDCADTDGLDLSYFNGDYDALEDYGSSTYGPYTIEFIQDENEPNKFHFDNLYDSGCDAYVVIDIAAGTVYFPNQSPCGKALTNSSGTFTLCDDETFTINLNYDGGDWVYRFTKH
jgi:hypothetical protein